MGARRRAESVSLACSRRKEGSSIRVPAKRMAIQRSPGPKRRDSSRVGSKLKLKRKTTIRAKTAVVVRSSRVRNSVRTSLVKMAQAGRQRGVGEETEEERSASR